MEGCPTPDQRKGPINACVHKPQTQLDNAVLCFLQAESGGEANCRKPEEVNFTQAVDWLYRYAEVMGEQGNKNECQFESRIYMEQKRSNQETRNNQRSIGILS